MSKLSGPLALHLEVGRGQVTLRCEAVPGAAFYEVERADRAGGRFVRLSLSLGRLPTLVQRLLQFVWGGLPTHIVVGTRFVDTANCGLALDFDVMAGATALLVAIAA
jgi:hypothetical protein